jgi:hypothetical protein
LKEILEEAMIAEEFDNLKPGDRVVFYPETAGSQRVFIEEACSVQEENGGFLEVSECRGYSIKVLGIEDWLFFSKNIELYENPNRPWSYERDY